VQVENMAMLAAPDVPPLSAPMTWADICAAYPDQHVGISDVVIDGDRWWHILSARVFCHGEYGTVLAQVGSGPGLSYPGSRHAWTGKPHDAEAHLAFKLAMRRRSPR
jgi:hypothetical protein